jgi:GTP-binding protein LepA
MNNIRNFSIIAHIDHGKSTLADRMLEVTGTVEKRSMKEQVLDRMDLERERGITIKMQPVRMNWKSGGKEYVLNLIDTPGHIDFAYEVSRALSAVEGVVLLVDATQGIEAQTLSTLSVAKELDLVIIPILSKIDSPLARVNEVASEVALLLDQDESKILRASGKTGEGVTDVLNAIVQRIPAPKEGQSNARGLIFDFQYSDHRGIIIFARIVDGEIKKGDKLSFAAAKEQFTALEVGIFTPDAKPKESLLAGEIGYIVTGIKKPGIVSVGDTVISAKSTAEALYGYLEPSPVIWASIYPESQDDLPLLRQSLERLRLTDSSLSYEEEASGVMGRGFRCGFLGMLHMEIIAERLRREFDLELVVTLPTTVYKLKLKGGEEKTIYSPTHFPDDGTVESVMERWVMTKIITPNDYIGVIMQLIFDHEGIVNKTENLSDLPSPRASRQAGLSASNTQAGGRVEMSVAMPLREMMRNFFDKLKNVSSGFASLSYQLADFRDANVVRLDVLVAEEPVYAFSRIISKRRIREEGKNIVEKLKELLPKQQFVLKIQAKAEGNIVAAERLSAMRKDVTGHLYGGDITRKMKLLEKQKKGKKKALARGIGSVNIPHDVFVKIMRES